MQRLDSLCVEKIRKFFIAISTSWLEKFAPAQKFPAMQFPADFFELLSIEFGACSKSPGR